MIVTYFLLVAHPLERGIAPPLTITSSGACGELLRHNERGGQLYVAYYQ